MRKYGLIGVNLYSKVVYFHGDLNTVVTFQGSRVGVHCNTALLCVWLTLLHSSPSLVNQVAKNCILFVYFQVARCTKIIDADSEHPKYVIHVKQFAKFVVNLHKNLAPTDVEEGMRVG